MWKIEYNFKKENYKHLNIWFCQNDVNHEDLLYFYSQIIKKLKTRYFIFYYLLVQKKKKKYSNVIKMICMHYKIKY